MKIALFFALVLASTARAEVIECPARYPVQEVTLADRQGRVQPARLSFAYMHVGDFHGEEELQGPESRKVRGGWDTTYDFLPSDPKWLVCIYGGTEWSGLGRISAGTIQWWGKVEQQNTSCLLKAREIKMPGALSNWTVAVTCGPQRNRSRSSGG